MNNNIVGAFEKVSYEEFKKELIKDEHWINCDDVTIRDIYNNIKLPRRATEGSAGYDFFLPYTPIITTSDHNVKICTGIRCNIKVPGWALFIYPKSGLGSNYGVSLRNTVGIIDSDYYSAPNEGHIIVNLTSDDISKPGFAHHVRYIENRTVIVSREGVHFEPGDDYTLSYLVNGKAFVQGVFIPFGVTINDSNVSKAKRVGGFGSTSS